MDVVEQFLKAEAKTLLRVDFSSSDAVVWGGGFFLSFWHLCCLFSGFVGAFYTNPLGRVPRAGNKPMASDVTMFLLERVCLFIEPKSFPLPSYNYTNHINMDVSTGGTGPEGDIM